MQNKIKKAKQISPWIDGRVVEGARLEVVCTSKAYRGFESLSIRHSQKSSPRGSFFVNSEYNGVEPEGRGFDYKREAHVGAGRLLPMSAVDRALRAHQAHRAHRQK